MVEDKKRCSLCNVEKSISEFGKLKKSKDGKNCQCKVCRNKKRREYVSNNRDKVKEGLKNTYLKHGLKYREKQKDRY